MAVFQKRFQPQISPPPAPEPSAAAPPPPALAERVEVLIAVSDRLAALLVRESAALERRALGEVAALQPDKRALAARFDEVGRLVRLDKTGLAGLAPELMARLKDASWRLCEATAVNVKELDVQAAARKSVIEVVVKSVNHERQAETAYASLGRGYVPKSTRAPPSRSMTINTTL